MSKNKLKLGDIVCVTTPNSGIPNIDYAILVKESYYRDEDVDNTFVRIVCKVDNYWYNFYSLEKYVKHIKQELKYGFIQKNIDFLKNLKFDYMGYNKNVMEIISSNDLAKILSTNFTNEKTYKQKIIERIELIIGLNVYE